MKIILYKEVAESAVAMAMMVVIGGRGDGHLMLTRRLRIQRKNIIHVNLLVLNHHDSV